MTIVTPASPAWHRRARRKRSLARGRIWSSRARGLLPKGKDLRLLRAHHSQPLYSELMGRGGPKAKQWQENGGRGWSVSASQLWKGAWSSPRGRNQAPWKDGSWTAQQGQTFPSFDSQAVAVPKEEAEPSSEHSGTGPPQTRAVQAALNAARALGARPGHSEVAVVQLCQDYEASLYEGEGKVPVEDCEARERARGGAASVSCGEGGFPQRGSGARPRTAGGHGGRGCRDGWRRSAFCGVGPLCCPRLDRHCNQSLGKRAGSHPGQATHVEADDAPGRRWPSSSRLPIWLQLRMFRLGPRQDSPARGKLPSLRTLADMPPGPVSRRLRRRSPRQRPRTPRSPTSWIRRDKLRCRVWQPPLSGLGA